LDEDTEVTSSETAAPSEAAAQMASDDAPVPEAGESAGETPVGGDEPQAGGEAPVEGETVAEEPAPVAEPAEPEPVAEKPEPAPAPAAEEPAPAAAPAPAAEEPAPAAAPAPAAEEPAPEPVAVQPEPVAAQPEPVEEEELEEIEEVPRVRPEIPGADLVPDIVPEADSFLDAEAQAAAEAEAEAAAARAEQSDQEEAQPIADAAIDLAAGARYTATGKRKTAVARVILRPGSGAYAINGKPLDDFFPRETLRRVIRQPLEAVGYDARMDVVATMHGGGVSAQAGALRHGISRALIEADPNLRGELKRRGFLTRDPRVKERKKAGLKKARKRPQFSKR
jgi:small subunit ribosomal protein S9